jgi:bacillithiol biosynthesis cysteine-adding enzyme BshC
MLDYLHGAEQLKPFYNYSHDEDGLQLALAHRSFDADKREVLKNTLLQQYKLGGIQLDSKSLVHNNIIALGKPNVFTITTGHQLCILSGPLYVIIKIAHAIKLSQTLTTKEKPVVPIFWMATEDHDIEEIKTVVVKGRKYKWDTELAGIAVGSLPTDGISVLIEQICTDIPELKDSLASLFDIYSRAKNVADATRQWAHQWFAAYGLVILDANEAVFKKQFISIIKQDVLSQLGQRVLEQSNSQLKKMGYSVQVNGRAINHFYFDGNKRKLIEPRGDLYELQDSSKHWTKAEIEAEIELHPERFSPNVVFRPLYQECILPNIAYVGGPGELSYWLQLMALFQETNTPYPSLVARASFVLPDVAVMRMAKKLQLDWSDVLTKPEASRRKLLHKWEPSSEYELHPQLIQAYQKLIDESVSIDNKIVSSIVAHLKLEKQFFNKIAQQLSKAKKQKCEHQLKEFEEVVEKILPSGVPQERFENIFSFTDKPTQFIQILLHHIQPVSTGVIVLTI